MLEACRGRFATTTEGVRLEERCNRYFPGRVSQSTTITLYPRIMFVSSVSSILNWTAYYPEDKLTPEKSLTGVDYNVALPMGYGKSKHVGERMLAVAPERSSIRVDILRVGQVAGPIAPDGRCWNKSEWFPSLIQTSKSPEYIPDALMNSSRRSGSYRS